MKNVIKAAAAVVLLAGIAGAENRLNSELPGVYAGQAKSLLNRVAFAVGPVSIKVKADFKLGAASARLSCHFEDGSGAVQSFPEKKLAVTVTPEGGLYRLDIAGGKLTSFSLFSEARACGYVLDIESAGEKKASGRVELAGSEYMSMQQAELAALLSDPNLNQKISAKYQPLKLSARGDFIYALP